MKRFQRTTTIVMLLTVTLLAACGSPAPKPTEVTVQLSWSHTVEFAGFYVADRKGYYTEEGLAVTLLPGGFDVYPWQEVAEGRADFGIAGGDSLLLARAEGQPLTAIAAIFRRSPVVLIALEESGIRTPKDLVGKRVGLISAAKDNANDIQLRAMLRKMGIDESEVILTPTEDFSIGSLTSGALDVYSGFSTDESVDARLKGIEVNSIFPEDYGVHIYADLLLATDELIEQQPDLAERFVRATLKGYQYAIENPDEAAQNTLKYDETLDEVLQVASMRAEVPLIDTGDAPIGQMDTRVWRSTQDVLLEQGFLEQRVDLEALYTNRFVEEAHAD